MYLDFSLDLVPHYQLDCLFGNKIPINICIHWFIINKLIISYYLITWYRSTLWNKSQLLILTISIDRRFWLWLRNCVTNSMLTPSDFIIASSIRYRLWFQFRLRNRITNSIPHLLRFSDSDFFFRNHSLTQQLLCFCFYLSVLRLFQFLLLLYFITTTTAKEYYCFCPLQEFWPVPPWL